MKTSETIEYIVDWIKDYKKTNRIDGFVIGVSGGIDSALTSTLCALPDSKHCSKYAHKTKEEQYVRANNHIKWLKEKFNNVNSIDDLTVFLKVQIIC